MKRFACTGLAIVWTLLAPASFAVTENPGPVEIEILKTRAADGNEKAQLKLAFMYLHGKQVDANIEQALYYYRLAAERDIAYAQHRLARLHLDGTQVKPAPARALVWLLRASRLGFVEAQLDLSRLYEDGQGITQDLIKARKWLGIAESLTDRNLESRQAELEAKMSFSQLAQAQLQSRVCILSAYVDC